ncbi:mechanosensitive channel MscK [Gallibacterium sp. AGMB14963]|nr:mechanosensitive channel MscK [Gallibacterium sp. AGMB14963]MDA3978955.1 mechanosensitive channel MscK [Gallibacterium sp. AGMB14963]
MSKRFITIIMFGLTLFSATLVYAQIPSATDIQAQITALKADPNANDAAQKKEMTALEESLDLLKQLEEQKKQNEDLNSRIKTATVAIPKLQAELTRLKNNNNTSDNSDELAKLSEETLQKRLESSFQETEKIQSVLNDVASQIVNQQTLPDRIQSILSTNLSRTQTLNRTLSDSQLDPVFVNRYQIELALIDAQNNYNQTLLKESATLNSWYELQRDQQNFYLQQAKLEQQNLQAALNAKRLAASKKQLAQLEKSQEKSSENVNPIIQNELNQNTQLSQQLLNETQSSNQLSQESLRIKNVLDNLTQTQRSIDEQISALQGTLVLSRIINQQKQNLPTDQTIDGLGKRITDLRVQIFDLTQARDAIYTPDSYIQQLPNAAELTENERNTLVDILNERKNIYSNILKSLNAQLNLAITIELNQQQVRLISDDLQQKLQQQSFWVKSNNPIDWDWVTEFPKLALNQVKNISNNIDMTHLSRNLIPMLAFVAFLSLVAGLIYSQKRKLQAWLAKINSQVGTLNADSQWHTPLALILTAILVIPYPLLFLIFFVLVGHFTIADPILAWPWTLKMAGYWWLFAFLIELLKPNGLVYRHFGLAKESGNLFLAVLKRSIWAIIFLINTSLFSDMSNTPLNNDVIGEVCTISALIFCVLIIAPRFGYAVKKYQDAQQEDSNNHQYIGPLLLKIIRVLLLLIPIALIILIVLGYYYTALNLISHFVASYLVTLLWVLIKQISDRTLVVSARRLAYKRLKEQREKNQNKPENGHAEDIVIDTTDSELALSQVKQQVSRIAEWLLWAVLIGFYYFVWSDLLTVAYHLKSITLWQQTITTETGTVVESITLLNMLLAIFILIVTYVLIRNLAGVLEVLIFSRMKLSQGAPYTITTLLTYFIVAIGAAWAFSTLGMSWSKLQWLFAALSVGLGFGLQEIFANFVSGIIILFERPVRIGDTITIGEFSGTVSKIRIRATTLVDYDGKEVIVPNKAFVTERLTNWALSNTITRLVIKVGVAYGSDLELTKSLLLQAATECKAVLKEPEPRAYFLVFGASTLDHELRVYVGDLADRLPTTDFLNRRINSLFAENNIEIAFNQLDVFIKNQDTGEEMKIASSEETAKLNG